jgi:hypothetical protein
MRFRASSSWGPAGSPAAAALFAWHVTALGTIAIVFVLADAYIGVEDALEGAIPAGLVPPGERGTAYGLMGAVNGAGDLLASAPVGTLWSAVSPVVAFACAGALMLTGAVLVFERAKA